MSEDVTPYQAQQAEQPSAEELRGLLQRAGLGQRAAARELEIEERSLRAMCGGKQRIPRAYIYALRYLADRAPATGPPGIDESTSRIQEKGGADDAGE